MTVAVAHHLSPSGFVALREAGREATRRGTDLAVIHVSEPISSVRPDDPYRNQHYRDQNYRDEISAEVERVLHGAGFPDLVWELHLPKGQETIADTILELTDRVGAEVLVIGSQRRTLRDGDQLGSVTQTIVAQGHIPVMVTKPAVPLAERR